ncbi:serine--tRNA synthetase-like protein Slimp [Nomia melanderi]|uniref:serine--tRNA synthetase-like protein Slimp n=1 Tax=Nomia melanderi TaxID=2448451 RepID=UPI0013041BF6|nr:serine--tRNA synthetase-like protein Slimp [Nomia melanderi]
MANIIPYIARMCTVPNICKYRILKRINMSLKLNRQYSSALFVSGRKAMEICAHITPYLDFDDKLVDLDIFQRNLTSRGFNVDAKEVKEVWEFYKSVNAERDYLESKLEKVIYQMRQSQKNLTAETKLELDGLIQQFTVVKHDLKVVKETLWDLSECVVEKMLMLPNDLDDRTPLHSPSVLKTIGTLSEFSETGSKKNHIEIGKDLGLLEYRNPMEYYMCNDAALFELGVLSYAGKIFSDNDMIRIAGADFSRSLVVEGCGMNHEDPMHAFIINNHTEVEKNSSNHMHLVGGASLVSFLAMHAKQLINPKKFPVKYFSTGRQYTPFSPTSTPLGLFTACQASVAHTFVLVKDANSPDYHAEFEQLLNTVCKLYDNVCDHYRVVTRSASELRPWERMRVSFELWSPYLKQYIEVGHISTCGNYLSKRLLIAYQTPTGRDFPSAITGTVMSVPRLLGCLLEQNPGRFIIPEKIVEHLPIDHPLP